MRGSRRCLFFLCVLVGLLAPAAALAKFGITKTRANVVWHHPPAFPTASKELSLQVTALDPRGGPAAAAHLQQALEAFLTRDGFRLTPSARTTLQLTVTEAVAFVERQVRMTSVEVRLGERIEKDSKGKEKKVEDCQAQQAEVTYLVSSGSVSANLAASDTERQAILYSQPMRRQYWVESAVAGPRQCQGKGYGPAPSQMQDPPAILFRLSEEIAAATAPLAAGFAEPRQVLLAVDDELKPGNVHAVAGNWDRALAMWTSASMATTETEAARQYNLGVAHEALMAYAMRAGVLDQAATHLQKAAEHYDQAMELDPKEKYFRDCVERIAQGRGLLERAQTLQAWERETGKRASRAETEEGEPGTKPPTEGAETQLSEADRFRVYVRKRLAVHSWAPSEPFKKKLIAQGIGAGLADSAARQVVDFEVERYVVERQNQQSYRERFEELAEDGLITAHERGMLRDLEMTLQLPAERVRAAEEQFQYKEAAKPSRVRGPAP